MQDITPPLLRLGSTVGYSILIAWVGVGRYVGFELCNVVRGEGCHFRVEWANWRKCHDLKLLKVWVWKLRSPSKVNGTHVMHIPFLNWDYKRLSCHLRNYEVVTLCLGKCLDAFFGVSKCLLFRMKADSECMAVLWSWFVVDPRFF